MAYNAGMILPLNMRIFSGTCGSPDGTTVVSLRFLMTPEEFDFAMANGIIPADTAEVIEIQDAELPAIHDIHMPVPVLQ
jgi:coenzyme F420-reducing hydrogenase beta subunit